MEIRWPLLRHLLKTSNDRYVNTDRGRWRIDSGKKLTK